jgi:threonine dehydrogenase-like Zn-dependent dehydrogenase
VRKVDPRKPGVGEVLIAVKASCLCRSDMSLYYGNAVLPGVTPGIYITGHEPAGVIEEVGPGVETFRSGADLTVDPTAANALDEVMAFTNREGLSAAIDCSGNPVAQNMALDAARPLAKVAFIGESRETTIRPSEQLIRKQLTLMGSWYFGISEYAEIARVLAEKNIDLGRLATHTFGLDEAETAFRMFDQRETEKAVFEF